MKNKKLEPNYILLEIGYLKQELYFLPFWKIRKHLSIRRKIKTLQKEYEKNSNR